MDSNCYKKYALLGRASGGEVPVVAISGMSRPLDQARAHAAGFDALLLKPFTADDLLQVIDNVIRSGR
jgi:CheY-like chemotaxis protein